jgi:hypothetical protein
MKKKIFRSLGVFSVLAGLYVASFLSIRDTLVCNRIRVHQKFCTYGFFATPYRSKCIDVQPNDIVCEIIEDYIFPNFHSSAVLKNPNGSPVINQKGPGDGKNVSRPNFSVISYHTKDKLVLTNFSNNSLEDIQYKRKLFYQFVQDKNQYIFQMQESNPYVNVYIFPIMGLSILICIGFFQSSISPD